MTLEITDKTMTGDRTGHTAVRNHGGWSVSWLYGRVLSQPEAVTAMTLAEAVAVHGGGRALGSAGRMRPHMESWAAELGMRLDEAVRLINRRPVPPGQGSAR